MKSLLVKLHLSKNVALLAIGIFASSLGLAAGEESAKDSEFTQNHCAEASALRMAEALHKRNIVSQSDEIEKGLQRLADEGSVLASLLLPCQSVVEMRQIDKDIDYLRARLDWLVCWKSVIEPGLHFLSPSELKTNPLSLKYRELQAEIEQMKDDLQALHDKRRQCRFATRRTQ